MVTGFPARKEGTEGVKGSQILQAECPNTVHAKGGKQNVRRETVRRENFPGNAFTGCTL